MNTVRLIFIGVLLLPWPAGGQEHRFEADPIVVVRENFVVPPNSLVLGVPGRIARETTLQERARIARTVESYLELQERYRLS